MTEQLQAALDALNACPDADAVAQLMRRHKVRAGSVGNRCRTCPVAMYLVLVGGVSDASVTNVSAYTPGEHFALSRAVADFVREQDMGDAYPDLEAE